MTGLVLWLFALMECVLFRGWCTPVGGRIVIVYVERAVLACGYAAMMLSYWGVDLVQWLWLQATGERRPKY